MLPALLLVQALAAALPTLGQSADRIRLTECIAAVDRDAEAGYETARQWIKEAHVREAYVCAALADVARDKPAQAARQFESLAVDAPEASERANLLSQAGNAWLLARDPVRAREAFDKALQSAANEPDLLIDRARAAAMLGQWRAAEEDLSAALDARPKDALALRLRAEARLQLGVFELAEKDATESVSADPKNVESLVALGRAREARRTGKTPD